MYTDNATQGQRGRPDLIDSELAGEKYPHAPKEEKGRDQEAARLAKIRPIFEFY